ncbi:MAG: hypothetical protein JXM70_19675 [Pirellulales bacterium]|nr:hypothetical protein [Pirellulales bacterium]
MSVSGCGPSRPEMVPTSGTVTIDGKAPLEPGTLYFHPIETAKGLPARPATATFDTSGRYTVKSFEEGDGLIPGRYKVSAECWEVPPNMAGRPVKSRIAGRFNSAVSSGLEEVVIESGSADRQIDFELSSR